MAGEVVHFELPADDTARAREFYSSLFGWSFDTWEGPVEYHQAQPAAGPSGAIYPSQEGERRPIVYFGTDDIRATVRRIRDLGGSADDPEPIPGIGWYARCRDTEGNPISLYESDPSVPVPE